jgi:hypothetical protein
MRCRPRQISMINWMMPSECWPPHRVTDHGKVRELLEQFKLDRGWGEGFEALVGYYTTDQKSQVEGLQLLNGSHLRMAALLAGIRIPVVIVPEATIERAWGNVPLWKSIMGMGRSLGKYYDL